MKIEFVFKEMADKGILSIEEGRLKILKKINCELYPSRAMAVTLQNIGENAGIDFLFEIGYDYGEQAVIELKNQLISMGRFLPSNFKSLLLYLQMNGFGNIDLIKNGNRFRVKIKDNTVIEHSKKIHDKKSLVCNFFNGVISAFLCNVYNLKSVKLNESKCICKGDKYCEFIS